MRLFSHQEGKHGTPRSIVDVEKPRVALIVASGQIVSGKGSTSELQQAPVSVCLEGTPQSLMCSSVTRAFELATYGCEGRVRQTMCYAKHHAGLNSMCCFC